MVLDTSVLVAILFGEPVRRALAKAIEADPVRLLSVANLLECTVVVEARRGELAGRELDLLLHRASAETVSVTADHVEIARQAWRRYGKGRYPAGLNVGDRFAYALARSSGEVLLYVGGLVRTDVPRAE